MITCPECIVICIEPEKYARCEADRYHRCCCCGAHYNDEGVEAPSLGMLREAAWKNKNIDRRRERRADRRRNDA